MNILTSILLIMGLGPLSATVSDHDNNEPQKVSPQWYIVNDGVMGGLSNGMYKENKDNTGSFKGKISLENNGGFSWLKSKPQDWNLDRKEGIIIKVKGDGRNMLLP